MKKILILLPNFWTPNGPFNVMLNLAYELKDNFNFLFVAICQMDSKSKELFNKYELNFINLNIPRWVPIFFSFKLLSVIKSFEPDIIHFNQLRSELLLMFIKVFSPNSVTISTKHGFHEYSARGFISIFIWLFTRLNDKKFDLIVTISNFEKRWFENYHNNKLNIISIYNGLYLKEDKSVANLNGPIIFVGSLIKRKGVIYFLEICKSLINSSTIQNEFIFYGSGPLENYITSFVKKNKFQNRIRIIKNVTDPKIIYNNTALLLHTALEEPFGLVLIEAMAFGIPVAGNKGGAVPEIIEDNHTGILLDINDLNKSKERIINLLSNKDVYFTLAENSLSRFNKKFSSEKMAHNYLSVYKKLLI